MSGRHERLFPCRRCGIGCYEWSALCLDCRAVTMSLREVERWASDYSRQERRHMTSRLLAQQPRSLGTLAAEKPVPRRDTPRRHDPLPPNTDPEDAVRPPWRQEAERWMAYLPKGPGTITHKKRAREVRMERERTLRARQERQAS